MSRKAKETDRIKVHSLGYMQEKFKRNLHNAVQRYILTGTVFVRVGSLYRPSDYLDERQKNVGELIFCGKGIELIIKNLEKGLSPELIVAQEVVESKRTLRKIESNTRSGFYHHLRACLLPYVDSTDYKNAVRDAGHTMRMAVRHAVSLGDETKCYVVSLEDISLDKKLVQTLESEYKKLRRGVIGL